MKKIVDWIDGLFFSICALVAWTCLGLVLGFCGILISILGGANNVYKMWGKWLFYLSKSIEKHMTPEFKMEIEKDKD